MALSDEYRALREGAALGAVAPRAQIAVAGADRGSYLQGLLTNDIPALEPGSGCYAAWLTPQGRMLTDLHVLESGSMLLLDLPAALLESTLQRLDQFLFSEDVQLESLAGRLAGVWVHGPAAPAVLQEVLALEGLGEWAAYRHARVAFDGTPVVLARIDQLGVPGYCAYIDPAGEGALVAALEAAGAIRAGAAAIDAVRIEAGYPVFGVDLDEETIPLEAGIEGRAISFTKGCYVGQEVIIRVLHRGGGRVARRLVGLRVDGLTPSAAGDRVVAGERAIGRITSAAVSPTRGSIALGYVHRDFVEPGTTVEVESGGERRPALVTGRPMPTAA